MGKRVFDICMSLIGLVLGAPVFVAVSVVIWLTDGPPVFFQQRRVGQGGVCFRLYKFRTMRTVLYGASNSFDAGNTERVTRVGSFLRRSKLDEFPQLWNVLRGDMSLVGPRPEVVRWVDEYPERWALVHQIRPGITDPASVVYRHEEEILRRAESPEAVYQGVILPRKLAIYEQYVATRTFRGDLCIILDTLVALFFRYRPQANDGGAS